VEFIWSPHLPKAGKYGPPVLLYLQGKLGFLGVAGAVGGGEGVGGTLLRGDIDASVHGWPDGIDGRIEGYIFGVGDAVADLHGPAFADGGGGSKEHHDFEVRAAIDFDILAGTLDFVGGGGLTSISGGTPAGIEDPSRVESGDEDEDGHNERDSLQESLFRFGHLLLGCVALCERWPLRL